MDKSFAVSSMPKKSSVRLFRSEVRTCEPYCILQMRKFCIDILESSENLSEV